MKGLAIGAVALSLCATAASATPTNSLTGNFSFSEAYSSAQGGPTLINKLGTSFGEPLTVGGAMAKTSLFEADPDGSCVSPACSSGIVTDTITVNFTNLKWLGTGISSLSTTATFTAKYVGSELSCAVGDGVSPPSGKTDCVVWSGAANAYNGSTTLSESVGNGNTLVITLFNATDWDITPQIGFKVVDAPPVPTPEPATLALAMTGLAGMAVARLRRGHP